MFDQETPSPIREIMSIGAELVKMYTQALRSNLGLDQKAKSSVVYIGKEYFLTFTGELGESTKDPAEYKACIYCFAFSSEPMLIFSGDTYHPKGKGFDASYWMKIVVAAKVEYETALKLADVCQEVVNRFGTNSKGAGWPLSGAMGRRIVDKLNVGVLTDQIIKETDAILDHVLYVQRMKEQPPTDFVEVMVAAKVCIAEEKLQPTLHIALSPQRTDFSKPVEVVSSRGSFSVNSVINEEVGLNLGKLRRALKEVRELLQQKYPMEEA